MMAWVTIPGWRSTALQHDVVEADDNGSVRCACRFEDSHHAIDGEVRPFGLLDLHKESHLLGRCPIDDLSEGRNACSGKSRIKAGSGVEAADLAQSIVGGKAVAVGGAVERAVVKHYRLAFGRQENIDFYRGSAASLGGRECRQGILRIVEAVAPVAAHMDALGFARQKAEGHGPVGLLFP
jgi:hypothetical protein